MNKIHSQNVSVCIATWKYLSINNPLYKTDAIIHAAYFKIGLHDVKLVIEIPSFDILLCVDIGGPEN